MFFGINVFYETFLLVYNCPSVDINADSSDSNDGGHRQVRVAF
jgi:hypothetical protein